MLLSLGRPRFLVSLKPPPRLSLLGCHIQRLFFGVGQALSPSRASVSLFFHLLLPQQPLLFLSSGG